MSGQAGQFRRHALSALRRYWEVGQHHISERFLAAHSEFNPPCTEPDFILIGLPDWAEDLAADGGILVPAGCVRDGAEPAWERTDWLLAAFHLLECTAERAFEREHGSIHSYSFRLRGWDLRVWERAWVNRIALFLRRWTAHDQGDAEVSMFGPLPEAHIVVTHDVDAIRKTMPIRIKQGAFNVWKTVSSISHGDVSAALGHASTAARFLFQSARYDHLEKTASLERERNIQGTFNFFAGKTHAKWLFDPGYDIERPEVQTSIRHLLSLGCRIGLHQSFNSYRDTEKMRVQRELLEHVSGSAVTSCRQHWLRFSWKGTWKAQAEAGLRLDTTLGYNDRPGFRAAAALRWNPWNPDAGQPHRLEVLPLLLMDSHLYDYQLLSGQERQKQLRRWLSEVHAVGGTATVLWHPHTLGKDYGWEDGFTQLLDILSDLKSNTSL